MFGLGSTEIILLVVALFLIFGASRLPQLAKSLGQSKRAFKEGLREAELEEEENRQKELNAAGNANMSKMSDEELLAEMRRRVGTEK